MNRIRPIMMPLALACACGGVPTYPGLAEGSTSEEPPCVLDEDCPETETPWCEPMRGECVNCGAMDDPDLACAERDPMSALCVGLKCVQCTEAVPDACTGETPLCDLASKTCVGCTDHDQCGEAACDLFRGSCLPADAVLHVGFGQTFASLTEAVDSLGAGALGTIIVHGGGGSSQLRVANETVLVDGIEISGNGSPMNPGLVVDGGSAWVDRGRIVNNQGGGIVARNAAEVVLRNCFVGGDVEDVDALVVDSSVATILYTTIGAGQSGPDGVARALSCSPAAEVDVRNSILVAIADAPEIACSGATVRNTASEMILEGAGNQTLGPLELEWFRSYASGDLGLAMAPLVVGTTARWQQGDPETDIEGDERPMVDGAVDYAGADLP